MDLESALDLATAKLAIELQLADIDDLLDSLYDTEDLPESDARTSFEIIKTDFQEELLTLEVKILSLSISKAEHDSRQTCSRIRQEEAQAGNDYQFARRLAQTCVVDEEQAADDHRLAMRLAAVSVSNRNQIASDHRLALQLSEVGASDDGTKRSTTPPANPFYSATNAFQVNGDHVPNNNRREQCDMAKNPGPIVLNRPLPERALSNDIHLSKAGEVNPSTRSTNTCSDTTFTCCACSEDVSTKNSITLACKPEAHVYCHGCLVDFFKTAVHDTEQFPPRCCKVPLPIDKCRAFLPQDLIKTFNAKVEELATPNPTYCSNTTCAEFIRPKDIEAGLGKCPKCMTNTCTTCKDAEHKGLCEFDPQTHQLLDLAERRKFQTCSKCNNMVELSTGCFHIKYAPLILTRSLEPSSFKTDVAASTNSAIFAARSGKLANVPKRMRTSSLVLFLQPRSTSPLITGRHSIHRDLEHRGPMMPS